MKNRKLKLIANVNSFDINIAEVKIQNFADEVDVKEWTELVCPDCGETPKWVGGYQTTCCPICHKPMIVTQETGRQVVYDKEGEIDFSNDTITAVWRCADAEHGVQEPRKINHWSKLKRVIKGTATALTTPRLLKDKEEAVAKLYYLTEEEFAAQYVDATRKDEGEKGIVLTDTASAVNLFKLLVAVEELKYVIIAKWKDTTEEIVALLTVSASGRILLREIIPSNLVQVRETLFIDRKAISIQEVEEAKQFIEHFVPKATAETFEVNDYRAQWKEGQVATVTAPEPQKVADIREIMKQLTVQVPAPKKKKAK